MRALYVGVYADPAFISLINNNSNQNGSVSIAAVNYTYLIGEGIKNEINYKCTRLFLVPMGMFPTCKLLFWFPKKTNDNFYFPFINLIFIKQIMIITYLFIFSLSWYLKHYREKSLYIFFSSIYVPFLIGILPLKVFKKIFITTFVPDLPDYEFSYTRSNFSLKSLFIPIYIFIYKNLISLTDYFVFTTKYMIDCFPYRPYSIIEGLVDRNLINDNMGKFVKRNSIMYAGGLYQKYGIGLLLNAFIQIEGDYELLLFGNGDMEDIIKKFTALDSRIKYFGVRPHNEILNYQKKSKLLINPRPTNYVFTKYSFPSKILEYLLSGTPVLTTRLPGIPDDYSDIMFFIDFDTVDCVKESIINCLSKSQDDLNEIGIRAKSYVLTEKNNYIQIKRLFEKILSLN